jgi:hypothetical protein
MPQFNIGDRVQHRADYTGLREFYGPGTVVNQLGSVVYVCHDNGNNPITGPSGQASAAHLESVLEPIRVRKPGEPPLRYGPYVPVAKALP